MNFLQVSTVEQAFLLDPVVNLIQLKMLILNFLFIFVIEIIIYCPNFIGCHVDLLGKEKFLLIEIKQ